MSGEAKASLPKIINFFTVSPSFGMHTSITTQIYTINIHTSEKNFHMP
jgi:hypothetical protein